MTLGFQGLLDTPGQRRDARIESSDKHKMQVRVHVVHQKLQLEQLAKTPHARSAAETKHGYRIRNDSAHLTVKARSTHP